MQTKIKDKSKTTQNHQDNENGMIVERRFTTAGEDPVSYTHLTLPTILRV